MADTLADIFADLGADAAPGQELRQGTDDLTAIAKGRAIQGPPVDFSHGDVDAHPPSPGARAAWLAGYDAGGAQAYTEYRGTADIRDLLAARLTEFTGAPVDAGSELILTPGTQGALFLALGAVVGQGTKVAVVEPDYFANRKLVRFLGGQMLPMPLSDYGPDLNRLEEAFVQGASVLVFSNPNNPTGHVYSAEAIAQIAALASRHGATVIVDQLYSRLIYAPTTFTHLRAEADVPENLITVMGPSKTESLSGFRLGVAFGTAALIDRMERLQAIVSLRAAGYNQAVLRGWMDEPDGWLAARTAAHQVIRDDLLTVLRGAGFDSPTPMGGSYVFPALPALSVPHASFVRLLRMQAGVTVTPGDEFAPHTGHCARLNFSQDHGRAVAAVERMIALVDRYVV